MLYTMDANHVREGLQMYLNGNPNKYEVQNKPAKPLCYTVWDQVGAQYVNDVLAQGAPPTLHVFVGLLTVSLHQQGNNGVINIYDPYGTAPVITIPELTLPLPQLEPRQFTINIIMAKLEISNTWATKFGLTFAGYCFEYKQI